MKISMINCPECKSNISDKATSCPCCGYPLSKARRETQIMSKAKIIYEFFCRMPKSLKTFFTDSTFGIALLLIILFLVGSVLLIGFCGFISWFMENTTWGVWIVLPIMLIGANIGGYFFLYKGSKLWVKCFLWCIFIMEIIACCNGKF